MDDDEELSIDSTCASDAIQGALMEHRGHRVTGCYRGNRSTHEGYIEYEVPAHEPLAPKPPRVKIPDNQTAMFDDHAIKRESEAARIRTDPQTT